MFDATAWTPVMKHRIGMSIVCLHLSAGVYFLLALLLPSLLLSISENEYKLPIAIGFGIFCLMLAVGVEVIVYGLHRRWFWAWLAGILVLGIYLPTIFLPLGAIGLWGLLDAESRAEFGMGK